MGLVEVLDASARFVGSAAAITRECRARSDGRDAARFKLVEVQALVTPSELMPPRRVVNGIDRNRLALVLAVLTRHGGLALAGADVFVNVVGGVRIDEPGADLAIALAVASAARGVTLGGEDAQFGPLAAFGELGLTGEVRWVGHPDRRIAEARKFGLTPIISPPEAGADCAATLRPPVRDALAKVGAARPARRHAELATAFIATSLNGWLAMSVARTRRQFRPWLLPRRRQARRTNRWPRARRDCAGVNSR